MSSSAPCAASLHAVHSQAEPLFGSAAGCPAARARAVRGLLASQGGSGKNVLGARRRTLSSGPASHALSIPAQGLLVPRQSADTELAASARSEGVDEQLARVAIEEHHPALLVLFQRLLAQHLAELLDAAEGGLVVPQVAVVEG